MIEQNKKYNNSWLIISLCLLAIVVWGIGIYFVSKKNDQLQTLAQTWAQENLKKENMSKLKQLDNELKPKYEQLSSYVVWPDTRASFIEELEELGRLAKVTQTLNNAVEKDGLRFDLTIGGNLDSIYKFLSLLENLPYKVSVDSVDLRVGDKKNWQATLIISVLYHNGDGA